MAPSSEYVAVDAVDVNLDRTRINHHHQIQLPRQEAEQHVQDGSAALPHANGDLESDSPRSKSHNIRSSIKERSHEAASKLKDALHVRKSHNEHSSETPILAKPLDDQDDSLMSRMPMPNKTTLKEIAKNPGSTLKDKVSKQGNQQIASNLVSKEVAHEKEVELLHAHEAVKDAKTDSERLLAIQDREKSLRERQTLFVRWTLDRHVTNVRILPRDIFVKKPRTEFQTKNEEGGVVTDWSAYGHHLFDYYAHQYGGQYIGYGSNPPPPSKKSIMPNIERVLVASAPFQEFIMTTRRVYRWENRNETLKYLMIYFVLWYGGLLIPGILSAISYFVVQRYVHGNSLDDLRKDIERTADVNETARSLADFIEKNGDDEWVDSILETLGPWLMIQLSDLAGFFEAVRNFYEWRVPHRTAFTLGIFAVAVVVTAFLPLWLLVKSATFSAGVLFFAVFPIATNTPDYRLLLSMPKRIFWNIPTHAEWAVLSIQAEGSRFQLGHGASTSWSASTKPSANSQAAPDFGTYSAHLDKTTGRVITSGSSVRFVSSIGHKVHFDITYDQITNLEKINRIMDQNLPKVKSDSGKDLHIVTKDNKEWTLKNMENRDQAFSQIIGFSDTNWQIVW